MQKRPQTPGAEFNDREELAHREFGEAMGWLFFGIPTVVLAGFFYAGVLDSSGGFPTVQCRSKLTMLADTTTGRQALKESWNNGIYDSCDRLEYVQNALAKDRGEPPRLSSR